MGTGAGRGQPRWKPPRWVAWSQVGGGLCLLGLAAAAAIGSGGLPSALLGPLLLGLWFTTKGTADLLDDPPTPVAVLLRVAGVPIGTAVMVHLAVVIFGL